LNAIRNVESYTDIDPTHASIGCSGCHGGFSPVDAVDDTSAYRAAHRGMKRDPSAIGEDGCSGGLCHADIVRRNETSIHSNLWGEKAHVALRNGYETFEECPAEIQDGFTKDCSGCHTTCGQCHVSRPHTAGGGFLEQRVGYSHKFIATPSEENVCTACHGSRVGDDWNANQDRVKGNVPDVHNDAGFSCLDCHQEDMHGDGPSDAEYTSRYQVADLPQCVDCHGVDRDDNSFHAQHWPNANSSDGADLACFVCHSQQYTNCNTCHAGDWTHEYVADNSGEYRVYPQFKLGKNPYYGKADHPHTNAAWITVRHVPVSPDAFEPWGVDPWDIDPDLEPNNMETWKYTSPHNIQRWTKRTLVDSTWADTSGQIYTSDNCSDNCHMHGDKYISLGDVTEKYKNVDIYLTNEDMENDITNDDLSGEVDANTYTSLGPKTGSCSACH
jgi:thiosulfate/3-mercaptopyruvate sulfurtransferase